MANLTDPLIRAVQGTDPQNLMEYITRQKIYDCRFWKEECFGMTTADVLEKSAKVLQNIGGTYGGNHRPTKFLCLVLKLLQLQPDADLVEEFITQQHFKYVRALGAFYLRLTGRPADIYETLEPLYADYSKLRFRGVTEWSIQYMDEFIHELFTQPFCCGIALPRLPFRETLQQDGLLPDGPRPTKLQEQIDKVVATTTTGLDGDDNNNSDNTMDSSGNALEAYLRYKAHVEKSPAAIALWEKRQRQNNNQHLQRKHHKNQTKPNETEQNNDHHKQQHQQKHQSLQHQSDQESREEGEESDQNSTNSTSSGSSTNSNRKRNRETTTNAKRRKLDTGENDHDKTDETRKDGKKKDEKKKKKNTNYGNLFKKSSSNHNNNDKDKEKKKKSKKHDQDEHSSNNNNNKPSEETKSDEYWNEERAKLGLKPLR